MDRRTRATFISAMDREARRRRNDAIVAWVILIFAAIGITVVAGVVIGFVMAILG